VNRLKARRPSAPVVINLIALSIVLGGQAVALPGKHVVKKEDFAAGAVTARSLTPGVVTKVKLARHAVTDAALDDEAVTGRSIRPRSVHGLALAGTLSPIANIPDADAVADFTWTHSSATVTCPSGARLLNGGITIRNSGNGRAFLQSTYPSSSNASTWIGEISTDTGGASPGELLALCLR
jgi:hypothetical protein